MEARQAKQITARKSEPLEISVGNRTRVGRRLSPLSKEPAKDGCAACRDKDVFIRDLQAEAYRLQVLF